MITLQLQNCRGFEKMIGHENKKFTTMKRLLTIMLIAISTLLAGSLVNKVSAQGRGDVSYQTFYDELSPYGQWIDYPEYGYVWVPNEGRSFRPYSTGGRWVWSDNYEWMWVSDYSWGWAPFHYGRWFEDPMYGWMWMPGYEWAPAWVAWRDGGDYYGWAPLRPGINISIGFSLGSYNPPVDYWCFAPRRYITSHRINNYCVDRGRNVTIINNTTIINNYSRRNNNVFVTGPRRHEAERYAGRITPVRFSESSRPGRSQVRNNRVSIYRPQVQRDDDRRFAPRNFNRYDRDGRNNGTANRNGNNLPERRNVFDRNNNNDNRAGRVAERQVDRTPNSGSRTETPERRNVFDKNNNARTREERTTDRSTNTPRADRSPSSEPRVRRNVFDRNDNDRADNNNSRPDNRSRRVDVPAQPTDNGRENRTMERRTVEPRRPSQEAQPQRRNVFDRPTQRQEQPRQQRVERQEQPRQQRVERQQQPQQPRMERQPSRQVERRSGNEGRSDNNNNNGRRNVFDRRSN
jgi:hypothetical protein